MLFHQIWSHNCSRTQYPITKHQKTERLYAHLDVTGNLDHQFQAKSLPLQTDAAQLRTYEEYAVMLFKVYLFHEKIRMFVALSKSRSTLVCTPLKGYRTPALCLYV